MQPTPQPKFDPLSPQQNVVLNGVPQQRLSRSILLSGNNPTTQSPVLHQNVSIDPLNQFRRSYTPSTQPNYRSLSPNVYESPVGISGAYSYQNQWSNPPHYQASAQYQTAAQYQIPAAVQYQIPAVAQYQVQPHVVMGTQIQTNGVAQKTTLPKIATAGATSTVLKTEENNAESQQFISNSQRLINSQASFVRGGQATEYEWRAVRKVEYVQVPIWGAAAQTEVKTGVCNGECVAELERLRLLLKERDDQLLELRAQNELLRRENTELNLRNDQVKEELEGAEGKHEKQKKAGFGGPNPKELLDEIERLKTELSLKSGGSEEAEKALASLKGQYEVRISSLLKEHEKALGDLKLQYESKISMLIKDHERAFADFKAQYESRISQLMKDHEKAIFDLKAQFEERISILIREKQSLEQRLLVLTQERDGYLVEIRTLKESYESRLVIITKERDDLLARIRELEKIIEGLRVELETAKQTLIMYENKIAILSGEVNRMKNLSQGKTTDLEETRRRTVELEVSNSSYAERISIYESQLHSVSIRSENSLALVACLCAEIESLRGRYVEKVESNF